MQKTRKAPCDGADTKSVCSDVRNFRRDGLLVSDQEMLVEFCLSRKIKNCRPDTLRYYSDRLRKLAVYALQLNKDLSTISRADLQAHILRALDGELSPATINGDIRAWRAFYKFLVVEDLLDHNPVEKISLLNTDQLTKKPLTVEEVQRVLGALSGRDFHNTRNRCIVRVLLDTFVRVGELVHMELSDLDLSAGTIHVRHSKSRRNRMVPLFDTTAQALHSYLLRHRRGMAGQYLFCYQDGGQMDRQQICKIFYRLKKKLGLPELHAHLFRHTGATWYIENGGHLGIVQRVLGHADPRTTEQYVHMSQKPLIDNHQRFSPARRLT